MAEETTNGANGLSDNALRRMLADLTGEALDAARARAERDRLTRAKRERRQRAHPLARMLAGFVTLRPCACGRWHDAEALSPDATLAALYRHVQRREANRERARGQMRTRLGFDAEGQREGDDGGRAA